MSEIESRKRAFDYLLVVSVNNGKAIVSQKLPTLDHPDRPI